VADFLTPETKTQKTIIRAKQKQADNPPLDAVMAVLKHLDPANEQTPILGNIRHFNKEIAEKYMGGQPAYTNPDLPVGVRIGDALTKYGETFMGAHGNFGGVKAPNANILHEAMRNVDDVAPSRQFVSKILGDGKPKSAEAGLYDTETLKEPLRIFHGTSADNLNAIKTKGLQIEPEGRNNLSGGGSYGVSFSTDKGVAQKYGSQYGGDAIHEMTLPKGSRVKVVDTKGAGIDEAFTYDELSDLRKQGYDAVQDISKGQEAEVRVLNPRVAEQPLSVTSHVIKRASETRKK
jgi:hypothetical protein